MKISEKIRKLRELKGFTQENIAAELGISQKAYSNIETGETDITMHRVEQISTVLGVSLGDLLNFDERLIFNNHNQQAGNAGNIVIQHNEEMVRTLKEEIVYLREENSKLLSLLSKKI
jgi:transcriptional regulator with XRE-family HTH domain